MQTVREKGEGTIFQRRKAKRPTFVSRLVMRDGRMASRISHSRDDAKAQLAELHRLRDAGAPISDRIRLGPYLERWLERVRPIREGEGLAPSTWRKHASVVRTHLVPSLGHYRLSELSPNDVEVSIRDRRVGAQSRRHIRATLRRALADAQRDGLVARNVAGLARPQALDARERTILDATQARHLIEATRNTRYGPLWTILVTTGLRISEALGLTWSAVEMGGGDDRVARQAGTAERARLGAAGLRPATGADPAARLQAASVHERPGDGRIGDVLLVQREGRSPNPSITVRSQLARENGEWVRRPPKTAKGRRTIPLTPLGVEALRAQRAMQDEDRGVRGIDGLVFTTSKGHPLHETNTLAALHKDLAAAGLPRVSQHDLRHSCATLLYSMGVPLETIADILGHSSVRVTQDLYRHRVADLQAEAAEKMQAALG